MILLKNTISTYIWLWSLLATICFAISNEELLDEARKNGNNIIDLPGKHFEKILKGPRDSYILVFLTSSSAQVGCSICLEAAEEYDTIVSSWFKDHPDGIPKNGKEEGVGLFFAKADLKDPQNIPDIFSFYSLQHVPRYYLFSPGGDIKTYQVVDIAGSPGLERAANLVNSIRSLTNISDFKLYQPTDWSMAVIAGIATFVIVYLIKRHSGLLLTAITYKPLWAIVWTSFIILMLCGHMYNSIRNAQLAGVDNNGEVIYFMPGQTQNQFRIETQILSVVYGGLVISFVSLVLGVPKLKNYYKDKKRLPIIEAALSILFAFLIYVFFAGYTAIFLIKQPGYPFSLMKLSSVFKLGG